MLSLLGFCLKMANNLRSRKSVYVKYRAEAFSSLELQYVEYYRDQIDKLQTRIDELALDNLHGNQHVIGQIIHIRGRIQQKLQELEHKANIPREKLNPDRGKRRIADWTPAEAYTSLRFEHKHLQYLLVALNVPNEIMIAPKKGRMRGETMLLMTLYHFEWPSRLTDMEQLLFQMQ